jgi:hypothetical protein
MKHRTARQDRRLRRALEHESLTAQAVKRLQGQRIAKWAMDDAKQVADQAENLSHVRTLIYDEQAKARTAPSAAALVCDAAKWNEHTEIEETRKTHLIPRKSLTSKLFLRLFSPVKEYRDIPLRQLTTDVRKQLAKIARLVKQAHPDNRAALAKLMLAKVKLEYVTVTNPSLAWQSDVSLLRTNRPDSLRTVALKRISGRSKIRTFEKEDTALPTWDDKTVRTWDDENPTV